MTDNEAGVILTGHRIRLGTLIAVLGSVVSFWGRYESKTAEAEKRAYDIRGDVLVLQAGQRQVADDVKEMRWTVRETEKGVAEIRGYMSKASGIISQTRPSGLGDE